IVTAEFLAFFVASYMGIFSFFLIDLFPGSEPVFLDHGVKLIGRYAYPVIPDDGYMAVYGRYLGWGYSLISTVPASMSTHWDTFDPPMVRDSVETSSLTVRAVVTAVIAFVILTALALQARCLGLIARLDCREALAV